MILEHINSEVAAGRYEGPFDQETLERLIGPFQTAPLAVIDKPSSPGKFRIIQDFSFPRDNSFTSLNSQIDTTQYGCEWGFFENVMAAILDAPTGTMAATLDVDSAYRQMPVAVIDQTHTVVHWDGLFWVDRCVPFGAASSNGIFGRCGDAMARIYTKLGFGVILKWVDDFLFIQHPPASSGKDPHHQKDLLEAIYQLADELGWPWKRAKTKPFAPIFVYLGFSWNIEARTVQIPTAKRQKYLARLNTWFTTPTASLKEAEVLVGSLTHCALVLREGRARLAGLIAFVASFTRTKSPRFARQKRTQWANEEAEWWRTQLSEGQCTLDIRPAPPRTNLVIYTDASTSFGLGVVIDGEWRVWQLRKNWKGKGRDIGWAEAAAVELAISWLVARGTRSTSITINCDNQGVVFAWKAGRSRNRQQNECIMRITEVCAARDLQLDLVYVDSAKNPADSPSRGLELGQPYILSHFSFDTPVQIARFLM